MESYLRKFLFDILIDLFLENKCDEAWFRLLYQYFDVFDDGPVDYFADKDPEEIKEMEVRLLAQIHEVIDRLD